MKETMKKRLAVFLCILFVLPTMIAVLPGAAEEIQAASVYMNWSGVSSVSNGKAQISVEKGQKFYIGDYIFVYSGSTSGTASMVKASYSSDKKNVASVNSKGYVEAKATGTAKITVKYKGKTLTCTLKVVKAGSFGTKTSYTELAKSAKIIADSMPSSVTTANAFELLKKKNDYDSTARSLSEDITETGFVLEKNSYGWYTTTVKLAVPQAGRINTLRNLLGAYATKNSPLSTRNAKVLKISSVSATTGKITVKVKKAPGKEQIIATRIEYDSYPEQNNSAGNDKAYFYISINNISNQSEYYRGLACMTKGSKTITIVPQKYNSSKNKYVNAKLKKNATYRLSTKSDWTKGKTFKVK